MFFKEQYFKWLIITILIISSIAYFFHFPVQIIDALSLEALPEYGVQISKWRIFFEPVLGLLLYFKRSLYAIEELQFLLVWLFIFAIINILIRSFKNSKPGKRKNFIWRKIINLPLILGLWFTFFVIILFLEFPNNTIINNSDNSVLVTTHSHTEYSHDGLISQEGLWKWHKKNGFDAFFITDHNIHTQTLDFVRKQRNNEFPIEPLVMAGEEFSGSNHMSLLGLKDDFKTRGLADSTVIDTVHSLNGVVLMNHWFDGERNSLDFYKNMGADGFEIENSATELSYSRETYRKIKDYCTKNGLIMNGGLDFHGYGNACTIWNAFEIPNWHKLDPAAKEESILTILKNKDQSKLKVLLYHDRPYYENKALFFRPFLTLFNYFRTLNAYQVLSWSIWLIFLTISLKYFNKKRFTFDKTAALTGGFSSLFLVLLGVFYHSKIEAVRGYTDLYEEYSTLLFYSGFALMIYSFLLIYFRFLKKGHS